jgi:hypothetical protein
MAGLGIYLWVTRHYIDPYKLFTALSLASWVIWRASSKYTYEVDKKVFRLIKTSLFGKVTIIEIPYRDIIGIYDYKPKLMSILDFRRTFRMNSALDGRHIWTIAYTVHGKKKPEKRRIYFKPSDTLLDALHTKMPSKVKVTEEEAAVEQLKKEVD